MKKVFGILGVVLLSINLSFTNIEKTTVVIDVGHGGHDNGAAIESITEKEITLAVAKKIKELNTNSNVEIILTRDSDNFSSLEERIKLINDLNPDYVISLHVNYTNKTDKNGVEIYVPLKEELKEKSTHFAERILRVFEQGNSKAEIKHANFMILRNVNCPVTLIELGYLTNENDRQYLTSEKGQSEIAEAIYEAVK